MELARRLRSETISLAWVGEDGGGLGEVVAGERVKAGIAAQLAGREEGSVVIHRIRGIKKLVLIV